jgi:Domain of unknown function (DUF5916)/Carbohydrate family 9 binding domain-like
MKKLTIAALLLPCLAGAGFAADQAPDPKFDRRTYQASRVDKPIAVDGVINADEWAAVKPIELRFETFPSDNVEPPRARTEAFLGYDDKNLYVAFRAFDPEPSAIRANLTDRDRAYQDDFLGISIDTFNDERRAFEFFANPLGVQMDLTMDDVSGNEDDSWDAIWNSAGKIHSDRYEVEMAIPFSQIRFKASGADVQTWGIDILRIYPRDQRYRFGLHAQNRNRSCYVCQMSKVTGFEGITPGRNVEIAPTLTSQRTDVNQAGSFQNGGFDTEPGVTARWGVTPSLTLNGAINPDFSQVEADSAQLDINNQFALFFNEKRPFFLEGADFFQTPFQVVYTRTVAQPDWGVKLTGKEGAHGGGAFFTQDARTDLVIPGSQFSRFTSLGSEKNLAGVLRYRHDIGKSNVGAMFTTRSAGDYSNQLAGFDGNFRLNERDTIDAQVLRSQTEYPDFIVRDLEQKSSSSDMAILARYRHSTRNWFWNARYEDVGNDFRADSGYMPKVGYQLALAGLQRTWWPQKDQKTFWSRAWWGGDWDRTEEKVSGIVLEDEVETWFGFTGPRQSYIELDIGRRDRHYQGVDFKGEQFLNFYTEATPFKKLFAFLSINAGDQIDFTNVQAAERMRINPGIRYKATRNFELHLSHTNEKLDVEGGQLYDANVTEMRAVYQFNIRMFVRALVQYTDIERNPGLYRRPPSKRTRELFPQFLFSYKLNPQTVLFVGYSSTRFGDDTYDYAETDRTLFVKVGYAWTM